MNDAFSSFLDVVATVWRLDYKPQWRAEHVRKWNRYLVLAGADRRRYGIPADVPAMPASELRRKSGYGGRWAQALAYYESLGAAGPAARRHDTGDLDISSRADDPAGGGAGEAHGISPPPPPPPPPPRLTDTAAAAARTPAPEVIHDLAARLNELEARVETIGETAESAHESATEAMARTESPETEHEPDESDVPPVPVTAESGQKWDERNPAIPDTIESYEEAEALKQTVIKYSYVEDWGRRYTRTPDMTYREWMRVKLYGGYELHDDAPAWLVKAWRLLREFWTSKGGYSWQSVRAHIRDHSDGSHQLHPREGLDTMPYGTFRRLGKSLTLDKYGKQTIECIPDDTERDDVLDWRRTQIEKYRRGETDSIDWRPPFPYTSLTGRAEWDAYWTPARREAERQKRIREAAADNA